MRSFLTCLVLSLFPVAAAAQDVAGDYLDAYTIFGGSLYNQEEGQAAIAALIPTLEGNWVAIDLLVGDPPDESVRGTIDTARMQDFCGHLVFNLRQTGPHGFDMVQRSPTNKEAPMLTIHHGYAGFNAFQRYVDETEMLNRYGMIDAPQVLPTFYTQNRYFARINLYLPSPDVMVMTHSNGLAEYFARCPAS